MFRYINFCVLLLGLFLYSNDIFASKIVAIVNENPITDTDISARVVLMKLQKQSGDNLSKKALDNIISDYIKISYAEQFKLIPNQMELSDGIRNVEKSLNQSSGFLKQQLKSNGYDDSQLINAVKANLAWQNVIMKTILPTMDTENVQIDSELNKISEAHGLPLKLIFYRISGLSKVQYEDLSKKHYETCLKVLDDVKDLHGSASKFEAIHYDLDKSVRKQMTDVKDLSFSKYSDGLGYFICKATKTEEYDKLQKYIMDGVIGKEVMFKADQLLKNQTRKAVIIKK